MSTTRNVELQQEPSPQDGVPRTGRTPTKLAEDGRYVIDDYSAWRPFASFLPGVAGLMGVPAWVLYVNRGQAIASFGVHGKDAPLLEFQPAQRAYQLTATNGFRTLLRLRRTGDWALYEPFAEPTLPPGGARIMSVGMNDLQLEERSAERGLQTTVRYFTLPDEPIAALVRRVTLTNVGADALQYELLDGLATLLPSGLTDTLLKKIGHTLEAWMEVHGVTDRLPYYKLRASVLDSEQVATATDGNFAFGFDGEQRPLLPVLADRALIFAEDTSLQQPLGFLRSELPALLAAPQVVCGRTPCAFFAKQGMLEAGASVTLWEVYGHARSSQELSRLVDTLGRENVLNGKLARAVAITLDLTSATETRSADRLFDAYCRQGYLDNMLRGGQPMAIGLPGRTHVYHVYSRKHGDAERDYNDFVLAPEPYSQGEGSYRDVLQNRRDEVFFHPWTGDDAVRSFLSLVQIDGYNPRVVKAKSFCLDEAGYARLISAVPAAHAVGSLLTRPFRPGELLMAAQAASLDAATMASVLAYAVSESQSQVEAEFHEGYWVDHWVYLLDLVESYLGVFPDREQHLLHGSADLPFFDSEAVVGARSERYVRTADGLRQLGSVRIDAEKRALIDGRSSHPHWVRCERGHGAIYRCTAYAKLLHTAVLKFATLDVRGAGIEMEAGRPGWYDALNGLPTLFGSSFPDACELLRLLRFLRARVAPVRVTVELAELLRAVHAEVRAAADGQRSPFAYWDRVSTLRETFRARTRLGVDGPEEEIRPEALGELLDALEKKLAEAIAPYLTEGTELPPTYFRYEAEQGVPVAMDATAVSDAAVPLRPMLSSVSGFRAHTLPLFLEGPVKALKLLSGPAAAEMHRRVRQSSLYDSALGMYKVNASLANEPMEIGRTRAFPPGWLENESIWVHMEYKYLLELLRAGLYRAFFTDARHALMPFLDEHVYGRSLLECSSFLVSSAHPDKALHGGGFVARLTGANAEFLTMWRHMMVGPRPLVLEYGRLALCLRPALPNWLFSDAQTVSFRLFAGTRVTYRNPGRLDLCGEATRPRQTVLLNATGREIGRFVDSVPASHAEALRAGAEGQLLVDY